MSLTIYSQFTLGRLIEVLAAFKPDFIVGLDNKPRSYRGYYEQIAFPRGSTRADLLLESARKAVGTEFEAYKGGLNLMTAKTPVWIAEWGETGVELCGFTPYGSPIGFDSEHRFS